MHICYFLVISKLNPKLVRCTTLKNSFQQFLGFQYEVQWLISIIRPTSNLSSLTQYNSMIVLRLSIRPNDLFFRLDLSCQVIDFSVYDSPAILLRVMLRNLFT